MLICCRTEHAHCPRAHSVCTRCQALASVTSPEHCCSVVRVCPAGAFLALAVLFFKDTGGGEDAPHSSSMVANALQQLQTNRGLRAILMIVGILLITYGA